MSTGSKRRRRLSSHGVPENPVGQGGTISQSSTSNIHTFDAAGNFIPAADGFVDVLIIAGGGGGGDGQDRTGGGGGAGGVRFLSQQAVVKDTVYPVVIGAGGSGGVAGGAAATNGANSSAFGVAATGGGHGDGFSSGAATVGGSGGGSRHGAGGAAGTAGQGFAGGTPGVGSYPGGDANANFMASGGGGSSEAGKPADGTGDGAAGAGGAGNPYLIRDAVENFAGGGGGGSAWYGSAVPKAVSGAGGVGGGGAGGQAWAGVGVAGTAGTANTGGGGGGGGRAGGNGAAGGSGRVIVRYSRLNPSFIDNFNRADNAAVVGAADSGQAPTLLTGPGGISGNALYSTTGANIYWNLNRPAKRLQYRIGTYGGGACYPILYSNDDTGLQLYASLGPGTPVNIRQWLDPAETVLTAGTLNSTTDGDIIEMLAIGNTVAVLVNGVVSMTVNYPSIPSFVKFGLAVDPGVRVDWLKAW